MGNIDSKQQQQGHNQQQKKQSRKQLGRGLEGGKFLKESHRTDKDFTIENGRVYLKQKGATGFIAFYAPWCHFCTELAPSWNEYAEQMKGTSFNFLAVDCTDIATNVVASSLNIRGYPTIKYIHPKTGEVVAAEYKDGSNIMRNKEGIMKFLKEQNAF
jgi:thiol-disulfide isomerase/thioredoxin